jgi:integrase
MGRKNQRGRELTFKPYKGKRGPGRWRKRIDRQDYFFGTGSGVNDLVSYRAARDKYNGWKRQRVEAAASARANAMMLALDSAANNQRHRVVVAVQDLSRSIVEPKARSSQPAAEREQMLNQLMQGRAARADHIRERAAELMQVAGELHTARAAEIAREVDGYLFAADRIEHDRGLHDYDLKLVPRGAGQEAIPKRRTAADLIDEFLAYSRGRMDARRANEKRRAAGEAVQEAPRENMSQGRFARLAVAIVDFKRCSGSEPWDQADDATAARAIERFRESSKARMTAGKLSAASFNENMSCARQFIGWAYRNYRLDRLPRNLQALCAKCPMVSSAKAVPLDLLKKLYRGADDGGKCKLLLALNCGFYAIDLSDLTVDQLEGAYLNHVRGKTGVRVRYKLWPVTRKLLKRVVPKRGSAFVTAKGTPLVRHEMSKKSGNPVCIDNVRTWFVRLCAESKIPIGANGYSFSNLRDTAATAVEEINPAMVDLFVAHADPRMARFYVDGRHADTTALDQVIDKLERRFARIWSR